MNQGAHVGIMSVYPHEKEVLYPPLTYLKIDRTQTANLADQKAIRAIASKNIKVITVRQYTQTIKITRFFFGN